MQSLEAFPKSQAESPKNVIVNFATITEAGTELTNALTENASDELIASRYKTVEDILEEIQRMNRRVSPGIDELYWKYVEAAKRPGFSQNVYFEIDPEDDERILLPNPH